LANLSAARRLPYSLGRMNKSCPTCGYSFSSVHLLFNVYRREDDPVRCPQCHTEPRQAFNRLGGWLAVELTILAIAQAIVESSHAGPGYGLLLLLLFLVGMIGLPSWGWEYVVKSDVTPKKEGMR
jgi:hypothetical protein